MFFAFTDEIFRIIRAKQSSTISWKALQTGNKLGLPVGPTLFIPMHALISIVLSHLWSRFLTSVANDQISQAKEGVYIPRGLQRVNIEDTNTMIGAIVDNFDQNEDTLNGKTTTHSMAAALYQRCEVVIDYERLPLDFSEYTEEPLRRYEKPH